MSYDSHPAHMTKNDKTNPREWLAERVAAVGMVPFSVWFIRAVLDTDSMSRPQFMYWAGKPLNAAFILAFVVAATAHARMGMDNVIDDYSRGKWHKCFRILSRIILGGGLLLAFRAVFKFWTYHRDVDKSSRA